MVHRASCYREVVPGLPITNRGSAVETFTVELTVPDDLRERFDARVRRSGGDRARYLREVLERDLRAEPAEPGMGFAELLSLASAPAPADQMTDDELAQFAEYEVKAHRAEKRAGAIGR